MHGLANPFFQLCSGHEHAAHTSYHLPPFIDHISKNVYTIINHSDAFLLPHTVHTETLASLVLPKEAE